MRFWPVASSDKFRKPREFASAVTAGYVFGPVTAGASLKSPPTLLGCWLRLR